MEDEVEKPLLYRDDVIELCDGHCDYGCSCLYCEADGVKTEIFRTPYETDRTNRQIAGILSYSLEKACDGWEVTVALVDGTRTLRTVDGKKWY